MKKLVVFSFLFTLIFSAFSQNAMIINKTNGATVTVAIDDINNITFGTTTAVEKPSIIRPIYIIGDLNSWNNSDITTMLPLFKDNTSNDNPVFTYTGYLPAGNFKFLPEEALNSYKALCFKSEGNLEYIEEGGGAFNNATAGYKTITINVNDMTYSISDYDVTGATEWTTIGVIGEFCGWDNEPQMSHYSVDNKHIWTLELTLSALAEGTHPLKFRGNNSWDYRWAPADPESVLFGKTIYLKSPDDNIVVREGGNYHIVFNDLTGHYAIIKK